MKGQWIGRMNAETNFTAYTMPIDPRTGLPYVWDDIKELYLLGISHSKEANVIVNFNENELCLKAKTDYITDKGKTRLFVIIGKRQWCLCFRPQESSICVHKTED